MLVEVCAHIEGINEIKQPEVRVCELTLPANKCWPPIPRAASIFPQFCSNHAAFCVVCPAVCDLAG